MSEKAFWSTNAIRCLLLAMQELQALDAFDAKIKRIEVIWKEVGNYMAKDGHIFTWIQIQNKWRKMKANYTSKLQSLNKSGAGSSHQNWTYYDQMDQLVGKRPRSRMLKDSTLGVDSYVVPSDAPSPQVDQSFSEAIENEMVDAEMMANDDAQTDAPTDAQTEPTSTDFLQDSSPAGTSEGFPAEIIGTSERSDRRRRAKDRMLESSIDKVILELKEQGDREMEGLREQAELDRNSFQEQAELDRESRAEDCDRVIKSMERVITSSTERLIEALKKT